MNSKLAKSFEKLPDEVFSAMASLLIATICFAIFFLLIQLSGANLLPLLIVFGGAGLLFCYLFFQFALSAKMTDPCLPVQQTANSTDEEKETLPQADQQEQTGLEDLSEEQLLTRIELYTFLQGVCKEKVLGISKWEARGWTKNKYREYMQYLREWGIVKKTGDGIAPVPLVDFEIALAIVQEKSGEADFWEPVKEQFLPKYVKIALPYPEE